MSKVKNLFNARWMSSLIFLLALFLITGIADPSFLKYSSIISCFNTATMYTLLAVGIGGQDFHSICLQKAILPIVDEIFLFVSFCHLRPSYITKPYSRICASVKPKCCCTILGSCLLREGAKVRKLAT